MLSRDDYDLGNVSQRKTLTLSTLRKPAIISTANYTVNVNSMDMAKAFSGCISRSNLICIEDALNRLQSWRKMAAALAQVDREAQIKWRSYVNRLPYDLIYTELGNALVDLLDRLIDEADNRIMLAEYYKHRNLQKDAH